MVSSEQWAKKTIKLIEWVNTLVEKQEQKEDGEGELVDLND